MRKIRLRYPKIHFQQQDTGKKLEYPFAMSKWIFKSSWSSTMVIIIEMMMMMIITMMILMLLVVIWWTRRRRTTMTTIVTMCYKYEVSLSWSVLVMVELNCVTVFEKWLNTAHLYIFLNSSKMIFLCRSYLLLEQ